MKAHIAISIRNPVQDSVIRGFKDPKDAEQFLLDEFNASDARFVYFIKELEIEEAYTPAPRGQQILAEKAPDGRTPG